MQTYEDLPSGEVHSLQFSLLSPQEIFRRSVVQVTEEELYQEQNIPKRGGLFDLRMGTINKRLPCQTCFGNQSECLGHFGHVVLAKPCWNVGFLPRVVEILKCVCRKCSSLLVNPEDERLKRALSTDNLQKNPANRLRYLVKACSRVHKCPYSVTLAGDGAREPDTQDDALGDVGNVGNVVERVSCGERTHVYRMSNPVTVTHEIPAGKLRGTGQKAQTLTPEQALDILSAIEERHWELLGFKNGHQPRDLILQYLVVCPPCIRPSSGGTGAREDDLTIILQKIVKSNNRLLKPDLTSELKQSSWTMLQQNITELFDRDKNPVKQKQNLASVTSADKTQSCLTKRICGKQGRIRCNLAAKRINSTARSVISPDVHSLMQQGVVPEYVARILTKQEHVNRFNIAALQEMVFRGPYENGGAKFIERNGQQIDLRAFHKPQGTQIEWKRKADALRDYQLHPNDPFLEAKWREICTLRIGDIVARHLTDGDIYILNRQPSLHRMSMMGFESLILPGLTFRLGVAVTTPFNADFDGDEMNMNLPAIPESEAEARILMHVSQHIVSPNKNGVIIGLKQDALVAIYNLTDRDTMLDREEFMQIVSFVHDGMAPPKETYLKQQGRRNLADGSRVIELITCGQVEVCERLPRDSQGGIRLPIPAVLKPKPLWTGKQLFSMILPEDTSYQGLTSFHPDSEDSDHKTHTLEWIQGTVDAVALALGVPSGDIRGELAWARANEVISESDTRVLIEGGELIMGKICKKTIGVGGALIHHAYLDWSPERAQLLINDSNRMAHQYLQYNSNSIGIADMIPESRCSETMKGMLKLADATIAGWMRKGYPPGDMEVMINKMLNNLRDKFAERTMADAWRHNNFVKIIRCGSKGTSLNPSQVMKAVGQQNMEGRRVPYQFRGRALPHCHPHSPGSMENGFVASNYYQGLHPQEVYFYSMSGRESLVDTAVKTSRAGYLQRKMCKAAEDVTVKYDGTVRDSNGGVIQFGYGDDNLDATMVEDGSCRETFKPQNEQQWNQAHMWSPSEVADLSDSDVVLLEFEQRRLIRDFELILEYGPEVGPLLPMNLKRLLARMTKGSLGGSGVSRPLTVHEWVKELYSLQKEMWTMLPQTLEFNPWDTMVAVHLRSTLCSKKMVFKQRITWRSWKWLRKNLLRRWRRSQVNPGESVGVICTQAVSEPTTQMTLNVFHFSGNSAMDITIGVPRFIELINANKTLKTPQMFLYLKRPLGQRLELVRAIAGSLVEVKLADLVVLQDVFEESLDAFTSAGDLQSPRLSPKYPEDKELVLLASSLPCHSSQAHLKDPQWSGCLVRLQLCTKKMKQHGITMASIAESIRELLPTTARIEWSGEQSTCILRIRPAAASGVRVATPEEEHRLCKELLETHLLPRSLKGLPGVTKSAVVVQPGSTSSGVKEWRIETLGVNLLGAFGIREIDWKRSSTNDMHQVRQVFGIEMARAMIIQEIRSVIGAYGLYCNVRHLNLLGDIQCRGGDIMPINRFGINRIDTGPLVQASFEETVPVLLKAARFNVEDELRGITPRLMLGRKPEVGTGCFDLMLDDEALIRMQPLSEPVEDLEPIKRRYTPKTSSVHLPVRTVKTIDL